MTLIPPGSGTSSCYNVWDPSLGWQPKRKVLGGEPNLLAHLVVRSWSQLAVGRDGVPVHGTQEVNLGRGLSTTVSIG